MLFTEDSSCQAATDSYTEGNWVSPQTYSRFLVLRLSATQQALRVTAKPLVQLPYYELEKEQPF